MTPDYHTDLAWLTKLSSQLLKFRRVGSAESSATYTCRCPICGDSQKDANKARFFFYTYSNSLNVDCKNCGYHSSFYNFVKNAFESEFKDYRNDQLRASLGETGNHISSVRGRDRASASTSKKDTVAELTPDRIKAKAKVKPKQTETADDPYLAQLPSCVRACDLKPDHVARKYLEGRGITGDKLGRLYFTDSFKELATHVSYKPLSENFPDEPRIVIPFFNVNGDLEMLQGRSLDKNSSMRYVTIKTREDASKIFGSDHVDWDRTVYCCEGPLDSLFIENGVASCDSALAKSNAHVLVWDNEPRNPDIVKLIQEAVNSGKTVVIWPTSPDHKVDINDSISSGSMTETELMQILKDNAFCGLKAKVRLGQWRRV